MPSWRLAHVGGMSICKKTINLIFLDLQLVHHFINDTCIATIDINTTTFLVLLNCYTVSHLLLLYNYYCPVFFIGTLYL
jgi:hypothetical protein